MTIFVKWRYGDWLPVASAGSGGGTLLSINLYIMRAEERNTGTSRYRDVAIYGYELRLNGEPYALRGARAVWGNDGACKYFCREIFVGYGFFGAE